MRYRAMAKHWIFEAAKSRIPAHEDGEGLEVGRPFTEAELDRFNKAVNAELDRMEQKLHDQKIIA